VRNAQIPRIATEIIFQGKCGPALFAISWKQNADIVQLLLENGANANISG
jgi:hypothetical protein